MGDIHDFAGNRDIVLVASRGLTVFFERTIHHHRGEAHPNGADAGVRCIAVVLVHDDWDLGVELNGSFHELGQEDIVGELTGTATGLDDHR